MAWTPSKSPVLDLFGLMLRDICRYEIPEEDEVRMLLARYSEGDVDARDEVVLGNMRACVAEARRYRSLEMEDAIQEGAIGLIIACDRFELDRDNKFLTYAMWWIKQRMRRYLQNHGRAVRLPCHIWGKKQQTSEETRELYRRAIDRRMVSISQTTRSSHSFKERTLADRIADPAPNFTALIQNAEMAKKVREKLATLEDRDRKILWDRAHGVILEDIAKDLKITRERVRQLEARALIRLANAFGKVKPNCTLRDVESKQAKEFRIPPAIERSHPWEEWFDGEKHELHRGGDFNCSPTHFVHFAKRAATNRGFDIAVRHDGNGTVILRAKLKQKT